MEKNTLNRLKLELESFKALVIANLIGAALTMAFTLLFSLDEIMPLISGEPLPMSGLPYLVLIIAGMAFAITWITRSAELMEEHDEITAGFGDFSDQIKRTGERMGLGLEDRPLGHEQHRADHEEQRSQDCSGADLSVH